METYHRDPKKNNPEGGGEEERESRDPPEEEFRVWEHCFDFSWFSHSSSCFSSSGGRGENEKEKEKDGDRTDGPRTVETKIGQKEPTDDDRGGKNASKKRT